MQADASDMVLLMAAMLVGGKPQPETSARRQWKRIEAWPGCHDLFDTVTAGGWISNLALDGLFN